LGPKAARVSLFAAASFLSASLLFLVEPFAAKSALPAFGGSPSVWNVSFAFYQAVLLAGYAWAHSLSRGGKRRLAAHVALAAASLLLLPVGLRAIATSGPTFSLLSSLLVSIGLPFFVLSTNGPLLQSWFAAEADPYWLYAAGNSGSLAALLVYPFLIEPGIGLRAQSALWSIAYGLCLLLLASLYPRGRRRKPSEESRLIRPRPAWLVYSSLPAGLTLAVTTFLSVELAPMPFVWTLPAAVYLSTLALAFTPGGEGWRKGARLALPAGLFVWTFVVLRVQFESLALQVGFHLAVLFLACLACHVELYAQRPDSEKLTSYYLWIALGGALGGCVVAFAAPLLFKSLAEYPLLVLAAAFALAVRPGGDRLERILGQAALAAAGFAAFVVVKGPPGVIAASRSFYGVTRVVANRDGSVHALYHGNTLHGLQSFRGPERRRPLAYFDPTGPVGRIMSSFAQRLEGARVAVIGLGSGELAAYARPRQEWTFYELDPDMIRIAEDPSLFTFLKDAEAPWKVVQGDGRLSIASAPDGAYSAVFVDAFGSDAVPTHLLTREALRLYLSKLRPDGLLAFQISNRHFALAPELAKLAQLEDLDAVERSEAVGGPLFGLGPIECDWVLLARRGVGLPKLLPDWSEPPAERGGPAWTDDFSSPLRALKQTF
jgi:SAM-dependent methyltransferase